MHGNGIEVEIATFGQDPEYHQTLTKAHVYHHKNDVDAEPKIEREDGNLPVRAPLPYPPPPVSYLQVWWRDMVLSNQIDK